MTMIINTNHVCPYLLDSLQIEKPDYPHPSYSPSSRSSIHVEVVHGKTGVSVP
jgi:hypothetical protein